MCRFTQHVKQQFVGYIALFIALGGVSYAAVRLPANSVGTRQIRPKGVKGSDLAANAVTSPKIKDGSLLSSDFARGQLLVGPPGPKGDIGPGGPQGLAGPVALRYVVGQPVSTPALGQVLVTAICPTGQSVVGGGVESSASVREVQQVNSSFPLDQLVGNANGDADSIPDDGWAATVDVNTADPAATVSAFAICATPSGYS
jgi:hypothetical protein